MHGNCASQNVCELVSVTSGHRVAGLKKAVLQFMLFDPHIFLHLDYAKMGWKNCIQFSFTRAHNGSRDFVKSTCIGQNVCWHHPLNLMNVILRDKFLLSPTIFQRKLT